MVERTAEDPLLEVEGLTVRHATPCGARPALAGITLRMAPGEILALVGESGAGKTTLALALMGLLPEGTAVEGRATLAGLDLLGPGGDPTSRAVAMVFQEPAAALHPFWRVGALVAEPLRRRWRLTRSEADAEARRLLALAGLPDPGTALEAYPHQLSGGQQQRVLLAMALACRPRLLLCDEPTTALDTATRAALLARLAALAADLGPAILLISHDPALIESLAGRVGVLYGGRLVEVAPAGGFFSAPAHPYARALLGCAPRARGPACLPRPIPGGPPDPRVWARGCGFAPRCAVATARCHAEPPALRPRASDPTWLTACHIEAPP
jgi:oligopeptide/dipeptide ABC transporter ATP-binding protein